jgi:hypothetical protein
MAWIPLLANVFGCHATRKSYIKLMDNLGKAQARLVLADYVF